MRTIWIPLILLLAIAVTGCVPSQMPGQDDISASSPSLVSPSPEPRSTPLGAATARADVADATPTHDPDLKNLIEKAKMDVVNQFAINADQIQVVEAREVTWPDASLGCPQPDLAYAQVLTPGYLVVLEAAGKQYPYHADQAEQLILCLKNVAGAGTEMPLFPPIPVNPTELKDGEPWVPVN